MLLDWLLYGKEEEEVTLNGGKLINVTSSLYSGLLLLGQLHGLRSSNAQGLRMFLQSISGGNCLLCLRVLLLRGHECHKVCQVTARVLGLDEETVGELRWLCRGWRRERCNSIYRIAVYYNYIIYMLETEKRRSESAWNNLDNPETAVEQEKEGGKKCTVVIFYVTYSNNCWHNS